MFSIRFPLAPLHWFDRGNNTLTRNANQTLTPSLTLTLTLILNLTLKFKIGGVQADILPWKYFL